MIKHWYLRLDQETRGLIFGFLGVLGFSLTLPATRAAVAELDPTFVGLGRAVIAAILAMIVLWITHQPIPKRQHWKSLVIVATGVILGFPLLSAWAMHQVPASHGAVITGLIPLMTAIAAIFQAGERPTLSFWLATIVGSTTVITYAFIAGAGQIQTADIILLAAGASAALGYAEGGKLAKTLGGWQVISWALVLTSPFFALAVAITFKHNLTGSPSAWLGFSYISIVSQFLAFFAWYQGMKLAGVARVGQIQLLQPFLTIVASAVLLGEEITPLALGAALIVVTTVIIGRRN